MTKRIGRQYAPKLIALAAFGLVLSTSAACLGRSGSPGPSPSAKKVSPSQALQQGLKAHREGNIADAKRAYEEILSADPKNKFAYYNLALIDQTSSRPASAEARYRKALEIDPQFAAAWFNLAILRTKADPNEAKDIYRKVITLDPKNAGAHLNLAFILLSTGEKDEANREFEKAVELDPLLASRRPAEIIAP